MKFKTGRQFGLGNRYYTLTEDFEFFGVNLPTGLRVDGSSVPKVWIMFFGAVWLIFSNYTSWQIPAWIDTLVIVAMLLVGICESSGWFMKPAAVHDYRFQNASTVFGWFPANCEYFVLMVKKVQQYSREKEPTPNLVYTLFHTFMGYIIALTHFVVLTFFGCVVWYTYYFKNRKKKSAQ